MCEPKSGGGAKTPFSPLHGKWEGRAPPYPPVATPMQPAIKKIDHCIIMITPNGSCYSEEANSWPYMFSVYGVRKYAQL